jgi:hypothetical protein
LSVKERALSWLPAAASLALCRTKATLCDQPTEGQSDGLDWGGPDTPGGVGRMGSTRPGMLWGLDGARRAGLDESASIGSSGHGFRAGSSPACGPTRIALLRLPRPRPSLKPYQGTAGNALTSHPDPVKHPSLPAQDTGQASGAPERSGKPPLAASPRVRSTYGRSRIEGYTSIYGNNSLATLGSKYL